MSGAQLEAAGQIRNIFPYYCTVESRLTVTIPVAFTVTGEQPIAIKPTDIPYDLGPDKSGRVFVVLNGVTVLVTANAGTTSQANGFIYYRSPNAKKIYLVAVGGVIAAPYAVNNPNSFMPPFPFGAEGLDNLGYIGFENSGSVAGTAANIIFQIGLNIGMYGDYAEPNWNNYFSHEHSGLPAIQEGDLSDIDWQHAK